MRNVLVILIAVLFINCGGTEEYPVPSSVVMENDAGDIKSNSDTTLVPSSVGTTVELIIPFEVKEKVKYPNLTLKLGYLAGCQSNGLSICDTSLYHCVEMTGFECTPACGVSPEWTSGICEFYFTTHTNLSLNFETEMKKITDKTLFSKVNIKRITLIVDDNTLSKEIESTTITAYKERLSKKDEIIPRNSIPIFTFELVQDGLIPLQNNMTKILHPASIDIQFKFHLITKDYLYIQGTLKANLKIQAVFYQ
jgi:hypothetical protein